MRNLPRLQSLPPATNDRVRSLLFHSEALEARDDTLRVFDADGAQISLSSPKARDAAILKVRSGEITRLSFTATMFIQRDTPNRNFLRFKPGILPGFGASFKGQPFLVDHDTARQSSRGGTITMSKLIHNADGTKQIDMTVEVVKAWAMESILDGTIDRFSIGWSRDGGDVECSLHNANFWECSCWPGVTKSDAGVVCEMLYTRAVGTEVSGVNVPAVVGTGVDSITQLSDLDREAMLCILSNGGELLPPPSQQKDIGTMDRNRLALILGLSTTATDDQIYQATEQARATATLTSARVAEYETAETKRLADEAAAKLVADAAALAMRTSTIEASILSLISGGKLLKGSEVEVELRKLGANPATFSLFEASVASMTKSALRVSPVGATLPALAADPVVGSGNSAGPKTVTPVALQSREFLGENPTAAKFLAKAGLSHEQFAEYGARARAKLAEQQ